MTMKRKTRVNLRANFDLRHVRSNLTKLNISIIDQCSKGAGGGGVGKDGKIKQGKSFCSQEMNIQCVVQWQLFVLVTHTHTHRLF